MKRQQTIDPMKLIQLDGTEGGGQMLRTALSLSMVTGQPFRMVNIRGKRSRPGLMRQHLTCVKAACAISDGVADGAELKSQELVFRPGKMSGGEYSFSIGTAGSTLLLFQTLLPALLHAEEPSTLLLEGGTHNPLAPPFEFIERVFLPQLRKMGGNAEIVLERTGFAPAGGGLVRCHIQPGGKLEPLHLLEIGEPTGYRITVLMRNLRRNIAERMIAAALPHLPDAETLVDVREDGPGQGVCCLCEVTLPHSTEILTGFGELQVTAEKIGHRTGRALSQFVQSRAPVSPHLADQLLLPMALAGGGSFLTTLPDDHVRTNISVIEKFLPVKFTTEVVDRRTKIRVAER